MPLVADLVTVRRDTAPKDMAAYPRATEAWELWELLRKRRAAHPDRYPEKEHAGVPGFVHEGSMRKFVQLEHGPKHSDQLRHGISAFLKDTGNAVCLTARGPSVAWWFSAQWRDVMPQPLRDRAAALAADQANRAGKPRNPRGDAVPCRFCAERFGYTATSYPHERREHPHEFRMAAEFICTVGALGGVCDAAFPEARSYGRHLKDEHGFKNREDRETISREARARAHQFRADQAIAAAGPAAPGPDPVLIPAGGVTPEPVTGFVGPEAAAARLESLQRAAGLAAADAAAVVDDDLVDGASTGQEPDAGVPAGEPAAPAPVAVAPRTGEVTLQESLAAIEEHANRPAGREQPVDLAALLASTEPTPATALAAWEHLGGWIRGNAEREQVALNRAATAERWKEQVTDRLGPLLDLVTS